MRNYRPIVASQGKTYGATHYPTPLPEMLAAWTDGDLRVTYNRRRMSLAELCDRIAGETDTDTKKSMKAVLPSQTFCALMDTPDELPLRWHTKERHRVNRGYALALHMTGLVVLDFDAVKDAAGLCREMQTMPTTLATKTSSSGKGVHAIVYASTEPIIPFNGDSVVAVYRPRWTVIAATYQERLGLPIDTNACDGTRLFYGNYSPDAWVNWDAVPFTRKDHATPAALLELERWYEAQRPKPPAEPRRKTQGVPATVAVPSLPLMRRGTGRYQRANGVLIQVFGVASHFAPGTNTRTKFRAAAVHIGAVFGPAVLEDFRQACGRDIDDLRDLPDYAVLRDGEPHTEATRLSAIRALAAKVR